MGALSLLPVSAATMIRSYLNETGVAVNDWHVFERNGAGKVIGVKSTGLAPTYSNLPLTDNASGGAAEMNGTLSGGMVPNGGHLSVTIEVPDGGLLGDAGLLDWYWTLDNVRKGDIHKNTQVIFASITNIVGPDLVDIIITATNPVHKASASCACTFKQ